MAIIDCFSNVSTVPGLFLMKYQGRTFTYYFSMFALITSFLYHLGESLDIVFIIPQLKWHELDNIGAMYCMNALFLSFTKFGFDIKYTEKMNYLSTIIILLFQKRGPWIIMNTFIPIIMFGMISLYQIIRYDLPKYYKKTLIKGGIFFGIAMIFFVRGLDDLNDYLRIYHSLWHIFIGIAVYYLWQIQVKDFVSFSQIYEYALKEISFNNDDSKLKIDN